VPFVRAGASTGIALMEKFIRALVGGLGLNRPARRLWCEIQARKRGMNIQADATGFGIRRGQDEIRIRREHEIYLNDMIVFFDYYFSAVVPEGEGTLRVVDYSKPRVHRLRHSQVEFEFPALPESDESTEMYMRALQPRPGEVILDLGAYAGGSTYFFAKAVGDGGRVAAFEPDEKSLPFLRANMSRHALANVAVFDCGIWSENTTLSFQAEGNMGSSVASILKRDSNVQQIRVVTLDEAARLAGGRPVSCIKMDIEGAEVAVLRSAQEFFRAHRPRLVIEPHKIEGQMNTEEVLEILRGYGYRAEVLSQGSQDWPLVSAWPG